MATTDSLFKEVALHVPSLNEVANVIGNALKSDYKELSVEVVECPNLMNAPWDLVKEGLGGETCTFHFGSPSYLFPLPDTTKKYDMKLIPKLTGLKDVSIIGAGAACRDYVGINSELIANLNVDGDNKAKNKSRFVKLDSGAESGYALGKYDCSYCGALADLFVSEGIPGPVIKVHAKKRIGENNFISSIRYGLEQHYGSTPVGMGGVFNVSNGKVYLHIMSDFTDTPLKTEEEINNWLKYFEMNAPITFMTAFVSCDPELSIRLEHSHGYGNHGDGGHYHHDTTAQEVEYLAYFNLAKRVCRYDQPK